MASFEIAGLAVELRQQNSIQGMARFKVAQTRKPNAAGGQFLSEGEHRCVALAAFMAELGREPINLPGGGFQESAIRQQRRSSPAQLGDAMGNSDVLFDFRIARVAPVGRPIYKMYRKRTSHARRRSILRRRLAGTKPPEAVWSTPHFPPPIANTLTA